MAETTAISWTDSTHNFWYGCKKVSQGCAHCYAEREMNKYGKDFHTLTRAKGFDSPLKWKEPRRIFTCSWSDFFIAGADPWRDEAWDIIRRTPQHTYQILTKRAEDMKACLPDDWGDGYPNVWLGVSVENADNIWRLEYLADVRAKVCFMSYEPALGSLGVTITTFSPVLDWVIIGGESGPDFRPLNLDWVDETVKQCKDTGIACFVKQDSGLLPGKRGRIADKLWIQQFPKQREIVEPDKRT